LAGAATDNGLGVGSLNWKGQYLEITGFPALDGQGRGTLVSVAEAIVAAAQSDADVISLSLGGPSFFGPPKSISDAIRYALRRRAIVVVAAGNSNTDASGFSPANIKGVIVVSAVDEQLNKAPFSNTNTRLERPIAAPGVAIMSSVPGSQYQSYNGTSMATPIVSGLVGILRSLDPDISAQQAYELLRETGREVRDSGKVGRVIQPAAAVERLLGGSAAGL
jgi:thermitase